ncbi:MAG: hypothetical protein WC011_01605 [Candidatus Paceibacterota bacterium]
MQKKFYLVNKKEGQTPLESLEVFRVKNKIPLDVPMTYAGRLDPLASGLLLLLAGEECKNKQKYLNLDKEYDFEVLFGFKTDTYDILGKVITEGYPMHKKEDLEKLIKKNLKHFKGKIVQKYPLYSSKTVEGKPLFTYARENKVVEIPEREVMIKSLKYLNLRKISSKTLLENIETRVNKVNGDFRQKEILKIWQKKLCDEKMPKHFFVASFSTKVTSGTYVRTIANDLGDMISIPSLAFSIKRTKVGKWSL